MTTSHRHYVYAHRRASDGGLFYVGKGKDRRAWSAHSRNRRWRFIVEKHGIHVSIIRADLPEPCALTLERIIIAANRHLGLANYVDGGGGTTGWRHSDETKARIGARWKGREFTPKMREALERSNSTRVVTEVARQRMSAAAKARPTRPHTDETRAKIAATHLGIRPSDESRRKMSLSKIGKAVGRSSPSYDHTERRWTHADGREFVGTRGDFIKEFGLGNPCVSAVINGRQRSVKGWRLAQ